MELRTNILILRITWPYLVELPRLRFVHTLSTFLARDDHLSFIDFQILYVNFILKKLASKYSWGGLNYGMLKMVKRRSYLEVNASVLNCRNVITPLLTDALRIFEASQSDNVNLSNEKKKICNWNKSAASLQQSIGGVPRHRQSSTLDVCCSGYDFLSYLFCSSVLCRKRYSYSSYDNHISDVTLTQHV